jgi:hypothetical protein
MSPGIWKVASAASRVVLPTDLRAVATLLWRWLHCKCRYYGKSPYN